MWKKPISDKYAAALAVFRQLRKKAGINPILTMQTKENG